MALATGVSSWTLATTPAASAVPLTESGQAGFFPSLRLSKRSHHLYRQLQTPSLRHTLNTWCALIVLSVAVFAGADEPPSIERLIPTGGQRGTSVDVKFIGKAGDGQLKILTEADTLSFAVAENKESAVVMISPEARPGVYWLRFCNEFGATELKPFIVGLIPESTEAEPNARIVEAQTVVLPSVTINGVLEKAGDVDTFAVMLSKGQTLVASMLAHRSLASPMDGVLQILNNTGSVIAQNDDDSGPDPLIAFHAPADGIWYVRTFAFPATPNSTIGFAGGADFLYRLTLTTEPVIEHSSPLVRYARDADTALTLHGWNLTATALSVPIAAEVLADGFALPHPLRSVDIPSVTEEQLTEERSLTIPVAMTGHILAAGELDQFIVHAKKDQTLSFIVEAECSGSMLDPVLSVHDRDGRQIEENDDISDENRDAELHLTLPEDGAFRVTVRDRFAHFGDRWFYLLRCEETRRSFSASLKSTAFALTGDKPLEIPVSIDRDRGFAEAIEFRIEGLSEGVTVECPRSEKDGESSKAVILKLTVSEPVASQGPIRVTTETVDSKLQQPVTFETPNGSLIREFWLTVR